MPRKINFCTATICKLDFDAETGMCDRHDQPVLGAPMKCIHCKRIETIPYGAVCPKCGTPAVGELGEPALALGSEESEAEINCLCRLERDEADGTVRLYQCRTHCDAEKSKGILDSACLTMVDCEPKDLDNRIESLKTDLDNALTTLGVDESLTGKDLNEAVEAFVAETGPLVTEQRDYLLAMTGMTERDLELDRVYWGPVDFLLSRLRALAPERLAGETKVEKLTPLMPRFVEEPTAAETRRAPAPDFLGNLRDRVTALELEVAVLKAAQPKLRKRAVKEGS